jgi:hypothetical protein
MQMALSCDTVSLPLRGCGFLHANIMWIYVQIAGNPCPQPATASTGYVIRACDQEYCPNETEFAHPSAMGISMAQGKFPGTATNRTDDAPSPAPVQTPRKESDEAIATQRIRNAAALVRAQQKVARERRNPARQPQGCSTLSSWTGESEMQHADANRRRVAA